VFANILSCKIEWPENEEAVSGEAVEAITSLLNLDQEQRAGMLELQVLLAYVCDLLIDNFIYVNFLIKRISLHTDKYPNIVKAA